MWATCFRLATAKLMFFSFIPCWNETYTMVNMMQVGRNHSTINKKMIWDAKELRSHFFRIQFIPAPPFAGSRPSTVIIASPPPVFNPAGGWES